MNRYPIERRQAERKAYCRGCDKAIQRGEEMVSTYSFRNTSQYIHFCLDCARLIGKLAKSIDYAYYEEIYEKDL